MVIEDDMDCLEVYIGTTSMTMNERFSMLAATSPFLGAAPRRARRNSTNDGPLLNPKNFRNQNIIDEVVHHLGLDWRVQELQQNNYSRPGSRAGSWTGSRKGSRAGSLSRYGSEGSLSGLGFNNWDRRSRAGSVGNLSQHSGRSRRSSGEFSDTSRTVRFNRQPGLNLDMRLQMRNAWLRGRRARGRGRGRGQARGQGQGVQNGGIYRRNWQNRGRGRGRGNRRGRARQNQGFTQGSPGQGFTQGSQGQGFAGQGVVTRSRSRMNGYNGWNNNARGRGRGRGRGGAQRGGISLSTMPQLKTLEQLDKELEEYMASAPASLDKQLEEYMAQNGMDFDL